MIVAKEQREHGNHERRPNDQRRLQLTPPSGQECQQRQPSSENNRKDQCAREHCGSAIAAEENDEGGNEEDKKEHQRSEARMDSIFPTRAYPAITAQSEPLQHAIDEAEFLLDALYRVGFTNSWPVTI